VSRRWLAALAVVLAAVAAAPLVLVLLLGTAVLGGSPTTDQASCTGGVPVVGSPRQLDDEAQRRNAQAIIAEGLRLGVPKRGLEVAIATAMQESTLRADLDESESDRDSAGLFQQRRAWGPLAERMDPTLSARRFFTGGDAGQPGLLDTPGWQSKPLTLAAQAVQRSAFPLAYAKWEPLAIAVVEQATTGTPFQAATQCAPGDVATTDCAKVDGPVQRTATIAVRGILIHRCASGALGDMLAQAARDGVPLSGSGWRDMARQAQLRVVNGCPDVWESESTTCDTWTAIPGTSQHEYGLAVDLTLDGRTLQYGTPGWQWMTANAERYGFYPLDTEPWHWQTKPTRKGSK
jgi:hypothetical protein